MAWALNKHMNYLALFETFPIISVTPSCYTPKCRELNVLEHRTQDILQTFEKRNLWMKIDIEVDNYIFKLCQNRSTFQS